MEIQKNKIEKLIILLVSVLIVINLVHAVGSPPLLPDHFKGNLIIDNNNAPINTEIEVYINNELKDTIYTTIIGKYDLYVKIGNYNDNIKFKINNLETSVYQRTGGKTFNENLQVWTDRDSDGITDDLDKLIGNKESINDNFNNLGISIDNDENLNMMFSGIKNINFKEGDKEILNFDFDFDNNILNLFNIEIKKQTGTEGSIIIKGIDLTNQGTTKSVSIDKLKADTNAVCIKDAEISLITEISVNCDGEDEFKINCPGNSGNYICSIEENRFKISGLSHSGIKEFYIAPPASPAPASGGGSSGGGGGGSSNPTQQTIITNSTNIISSSATENKNENEGIEEISATISSGITGSVIGFAKTKKGTISITFIGLILMVGIFVLFKRNKTIFK